MLISGFVMFTLLFNGLAWASNKSNHSLFTHPSGKHSHQNHKHLVADTLDQSHDQISTNNDDDISEKNCGHHCHGSAHFVVGLISSFSFLPASYKERYKTNILLTHISLSLTPPVPPPLYI